MRHLPVVEWRARSRVPRQPAVLREGRRFEFDLHGQVERRRFCGNSLPEVDEMGEDLKLQAEMHVMENNEHSQEVEDSVSIPSDGESPENDFLVTQALRVVNQKLKDGIAGVAERALTVLRTIVHWCWSALVRVFKDGVPAVLRACWSLIKFLFGRKMLNFIWENILLVILLPFFLSALMWPFFVYWYNRFFTDSAPSMFWFWVGWLWFLVVGCAGAWAGFKKGAFARLRQKFKERRAARDIRAEESSAQNEIS